MKHVVLLLTLLLCFFGPTQLGGQTTTNKPVDPYFIESTDTVSQFGPDHITRDILQDSKGRYWFATWLGIISYDGKWFTNHTLKDGLIHVHVLCCYENKKGNLWFGTARGGVYRYDGSSFRLFTTKDGLLDNNVSCIAEDNSGNIWFGTERGASRYDGKAFKNFGKNEGLNGTFVNSIIADKLGRLWFGTAEALYFFDGRSVGELKNKDGRSFRVLSLLEDKAGNLWIGKWNGLTCYDGKAFTNFLSDLLTYYLVEDGSRNIWLSHSEPNIVYSDLPKQVLYRYDGKSFITIMEKYEPNDFQIFGKTFDRNGNLWFGTMHGPCRYDGRSFTYFTR